MDYMEQLSELYSAECSSNHELYLQAHSRSTAVVQRQISIFERLSSYVPESGRVLDWGCHHAPDACMVRILRGDAVDIFGCDVGPGEYPVFHKFAHLEYSQLTHAFRLPYEDDFFDAIIGSGVLEHVPNDSESLKELHRVLKANGVFIMSMLPNRLSYTEWMNRRLGNPHHVRLYGLMATKKMFLHHGFLPLMANYHQVLPSFASTGSKLFDSPLLIKYVERLFSLNEVAERIWPMSYFAANIFIAARKMASL